MKAKILCAIAILFSTFCNASESNFLEDSVLMQLHSQRDMSIRMVSKGKYYLNPERLSLSEEGLLLHSDLIGVIALAHLSQDREGLYVMRQYHQYQCDRCGYVYDRKPSECDRCGGTSFSPYGPD